MFCHILGPFKNLNQFISTKQFIYLNLVRHIKSLMEVLSILIIVIFFFIYSIHFFCGFGIFSFLLLYLSLPTFISAYFVWQEVIVDPNVTQYKLTRLHPGSLYNVNLQTLRGARRTGNTFTTFTTGTLFYFKHVYKIIKKFITLSSVFFFLLRKSAVPLPHWLFSGAAEWHPDFRSGGDLPWRETGKVDDGLLRHGDGWRRLDGTSTRCVSGRSGDMNAFKILQTKYDSFYSASHENLSLLHHFVSVTFFPHCCIMGLLVTVPQ